MTSSELSQIHHDFTFFGIKHNDVKNYFLGEIPKFISNVNTIIYDFISKNNSKVVALGPSYSGLTYKEAGSHLRLYRFCNKFVVPSDSDKVRATSSVSNMLNYDNEGLRDFNITDVPNEFHRYQLQKARYGLRKQLKKLFKLDISDFDMPSGETFISSRGDVSVYSKLKDIKQWQCSPSNFDFFAEICYNSPALKYAAKQHIKALGLKHHKFSGSSSDAFQIFKYKLSKVVTFVDVSRLTTVPKNKDTDRVILCEPMCNMICQRCIAKAIVSFIDKSFNLDLYDAQRVHGTLLSLVESSTIDLKNASNSNWLAFIRWYLEDTALLNMLEKARIGVVEYKEEYHHLNMIAPMGNGYTFEVMTLILLSITREFDSFAHVFGDDIIVDDIVAEDVIETLQSIGYNINTQKTFVASSFKESCGSFICDNQYITSFDMKFSENVTEAISTVNKVFVLQKLDDLYAPLYRALIEITPLALLTSDGYDIPYPSDPRVNYVPKSYNSNISNLGIFDLNSKVLLHDRQLRKKRKKSSQEKKTPDNILHNLHNYNIKIGSAKKTFSKRNRSWYPIDDVKGILAWHYLYAGLGLPSLRRGVTLISKGT